MSQPTLTTIQKQLDDIKTRLDVADWFSESKAELEVGMAPGTLRKMRRNPDHSKGWKAIFFDKVDSKGRRVVRNPMWSKHYIHSLFKQVA